MRTLPFLAPLLALSWTGAAAPEARAAQSIGGERRIVFVRGGAGSGGFNEDGADEHLSDIDDFSTAPGNHGYGELAELLRADGFVVEQVVEGASPSETPVDLGALDLSNVAVLVLASNNAPYDAADAALVTEFVRSGGGLLAISDASWGSDWGDAPSSDQTFLDPFDLVMNQDRSSYVVTRAGGDFREPDHPILLGVDGVLGTADDVDAFEGEGVSALTAVDLVPGVTSTILVKAKGGVQLNDDPNGGTARVAGPNDGALAVAELGAGRVAGHFDRNTFFNANGAGTSLHEHDNTAYARSLFAWLAGPVVQPYGVGKPSSAGGVPRLEASGMPSVSGPGFAVVVVDAVPGRFGLFLSGARFEDRPFQGGRLYVANTRRLPVLVTDGVGSATQPVPVTPELVGSYRHFQFWYRDPMDPAGFASGLSGALRVAFTP